MTNQKRLLRKAKALVKLIRRAREEVAKPKSEAPSIRFARAIVAANRSN